MTELRTSRKAQTAEHTAPEVIFEHEPKGSETSTFLDTVKIKTKQAPEKSI